MPPRANPVPPDKIAELLAEKGHHRIAVVLIIAAGLRRGEAAGLCWGNVGLDSAKIRIGEQRIPGIGGAQFAEPKAEASVRTIALPPEAVDDLRAHRKATAERLLALGVRLGLETTRSANRLAQRH